MQVRYLAADPSSMSPIQHSTLGPAPVGLVRVRRTEALNTLLDQQGINSRGHTLNGLLAGSVSTMKTPHSGYTGSTRTGSPDKVARWTPRFPADPWGKPSNSSHTGPTQRVADTRRVTRIVPSPVPSGEPNSSGNDAIRISDPPLAKQVLSRLR